MTPLHVFATHLAEHIRTTTFNDDHADWVIASAGITEGEEL